MMVDVLGVKARLSTFSFDFVMALQSQRRVLESSVGISYSYPLPSFVLRLDLIKTFINFDK